jgi:transmembrane sensor
MNMDEQFADNSPRADADDEAGVWFVRLLEPDCPEHVRAEFERWRAASPVHAAAYRETVYLWRQSEDAVKDAAIMVAANRALHSPSAEPRLLHRWFYPAAALTFSAILALVVIPRWYVAPTDPPGTHYATITGQQRTVHLKDGSSIVLDTDTELVERYSESTRRIDLLHGQAQFQVQGNPAWPFVVHAQSGTVTAVGTEFQVRINGDRTAVTLLKGKLAIATQPQSGTPQFASLVAGEQLAFDQSGRIDPVHPADVQGAEGWTRGKLFAHDWRLPDLLAEMNRYSATQLQIGDPSLQDIRISGAFHAGDQATLIQALQQGWPIRADRVSAQRVVLLRRR